MLQNFIPKNFSTCNVKLALRLFPQRVQKVDAGEKIGALKGDPKEILEKVAGMVEEAGEAPALTV